MVHGKKLSLTIIVYYAIRDGRKRFLLSSAMFAERDQRRVLQIAWDKKCIHPEVHIIFSSTHARKPCVFKNLKRAAPTVFDQWKSREKTHNREKNFPDREKNFESVASKVPSHGCRKTQTRCVLDEWKWVRKMCPLARTHLNRSAFAFSCSHGTSP